MRMISLLLLAALLLTACQSAPAQATSTVPPTTVPATTVPPTTVPATTVPPTTVPATTVPPTTVPAATVPPTTVPETVPAQTQPPATQPPRDGLVVGFSPQVPNPGQTFTGAPVLEEELFTLVDPDNQAGYSTGRNGFSFGVAANETPHNTTVSNQSRFDAMGYPALAWDNKTQEKVLYLTFDCGYAFGTLTSDILNTLAEKQVKAAFFVTWDYLRSSPNVVARMIQEGHIVGNHSTTHPDCTSISREKLTWELLGTHNYLRVNFGYSPTYFRFPTGAYSESTLQVVSSFGYRSIFWSIAHVDWDPYNQPGQEVSYQTVIDRLHPGAVILLHTTSPDNAAVLGRIIDQARSMGYEFRSLDQYPGWTH